jgi:single stranded DNA-binding protein
MIIKTIVGNLGQDPKMETTKGGAQVCKLNVAAKFGKETKWHNVAVFGKQAEACAKYLTKGQGVVVIGECSYAKKDDKEYENISALKVTFLGKPEKAEEEKLPDIPF